MTYATNTRISVVAVIALGIWARADGPAQIGPSSPVTHVGVVTSNLEETARQYTRVMGFAPPAINDVTVEAPAGEKVTFKLATVYMPNFFIELIQPIGNNGPYAEHLQKFGMS